MHHYVRAIPHAPILQTYVPTCAVHIILPPGSRPRTASRSHHLFSTPVPTANWSTARNPRVATHPRDPPNTQTRKQAATRQRGSWRPAKVTRRVVSARRPARSLDTPGRGAERSSTLPAQPRHRGEG